MPKSHARTAEEREERYRTKALHRLAAAPQDQDHPIIALVRTRLRTLPSPLSAYTYVLIYLKYLRWCEAQAVDPLAADATHARAWQGSLRHLSQKTANAYVLAIAGLYREAQLEGLLVRSPFDRLRVRNVKPETPSPALLPDELKRFLQVFAAELRSSGDVSLAPQRDFAIAYLMARAGLRRIEVARLTWGDLGRGALPTTLSVLGKGSKRAMVHLPSDVSATLANLRYRLESNLGRSVRRDEAVFPRLVGGGSTIVRSGGSMVPLAPPTISGLIRRRMEDAGLDGPRYSAHALRATAATEAYRACKDIVEVSHMLRHESIETTRLYLRRIGEPENAAAGSWRPEIDDPELLSLVAAADAAPPTTTDFDEAA